MSDELKAMAQSLVEAVGDKTLPINDALKEAAQLHLTTPGQMKYALTYATVKGLLRIDFNHEMVTAHD